MKKTKCRHEEGVQVRLRVSGYWDQLVMPDGSVDFTNTDDMRHYQPKTGTCYLCGKRLPNPNYVP